MSTHTAVETLLARVRDWWRAQNELAGINPEELARVAADLGMSARALKGLVARGPDAANLLYERMQALGHIESGRGSCRPGCVARSPKDVRMLQ